MKGLALHLQEVLAENKSNIKMLVISNPHSKKNIGRKHRKEKLKQSVGDFGVVEQTQTVDEIEPLIAGYADEGIDFILNDGGDGGINFIINTAKPYYDSLGKTMPFIVPTNGGTIDFLAKTAGIYGDVFHIINEIKKVYTEHRDLPVVEVESLIVEGRQLIGGRERDFSRIGFAAALAGVGANFFKFYYEFDSRGADTIFNILFLSLHSVMWQEIHKYIPVIPYGLRRYAEILEKQPARVLIDGAEVPMKEFNCLNAGSIPTNLAGVVGIFPLAEEPGRLNFHAGTMSAIDIVKILHRVIIIFGNKARSVPPRSNLIDKAGHSMDIWATDRKKLLNPIVDGERFTHLTEVHVRPFDKIPIPSISR